MAHPTIMATGQFVLRDGVLLTDQGMMQFIMDLEAGLVKIII